MKKQNKSKSADSFFCRVCGAKLIKSLVGAETYLVISEFGDYYPYSAYDRNTGKRNYLYRYKCPHKRWWNGHDDFIVDNLITK